MKKIVNFGIIGGGLMGKEAASSFARWFVLNNFPVNVRLKAVCDVDDNVLDWYKQIDTVTLLTNDYRKLLASDIDVVYAALPHHLHEDVYIAVMEAGKDLLAEKPFGINLAAAKNVFAAADRTGRFVRCSSEFPFLPGVQRLISEYHASGFGKLLGVCAGFHHSSDLDPLKPNNWKRQVQFCGETGVMADLGIHAMHVPLRLGFSPLNVYAQLQKIYYERPDGKGGMSVCDTWDNATLHCEIQVDDLLVPMRIETKRMAPTETNTWFIEIMGTNRGVRYSTKEPKTFYTYKRGKEQCWAKTDLGFSSVFPTTTGSIFETGFPDCFLQMLASFVAEREGFLDHRFGCVKPSEAIKSHELFSAALESHKGKKVVPL